MRIAIGLVMAGCLLAAGCKKNESGESAASNAPACAVADDVLLKIDSFSENVGMQEAFQAGLQTLPEDIRVAAVNRIDAKVAADGARMRVQDPAARQWVALLLLSSKSEARAVEDFRYCNGDFDFGNGQRWHWTYSMTNGPAGPELRIQSAQMAAGGMVAGAAGATPPQGPAITVAGVAIGNALGADQQVALPSDVLSSDEKVIYAAVTTRGGGSTAPAAGATLTAKWVRADTGQTLFEESKTVAGNGAGVTVFSLQNAGGWSPGPYRVEIGLNGAPALAHPFQIQSGDAAAPAAADPAVAADPASGDDPRERERLAEEKRQLENDRRALERQRREIAAQRAAAEAEAARLAREQEQAWQEQQQAQQRGPTADELYESRRHECPGGFLGSECRKRIREQVCAGHWSPNPEPGYSNCRR